MYMAQRNFAAICIALGLFLAGWCIKKGLDNFAGKDRVVSVKGLSEQEYPADKVIWPLTYKEVGDDLLALYDRIKANNAVIVSFLKGKGLSDTEITVSAPQVVDLKADRYASQRDISYRYNVTSVVTVTSNQVDLVRSLMAEQGELLKKGIALNADDYRYTPVFEFTQLNIVKPQMIEEATKNAREAARQFAKDSQSELGKIKRATQGQFSITDRDANTPFVKKVRVVTTVDYFLED